MTAYRSYASRFVIAAGVAVAVLGSAALPAPAAGVDPTTVAPHPITTAPPAVPIGIIATQELSGVSVQASGTEATITFTTPEPTTASVSVKPMAAVDALPVLTSGPIHPPVAGGAGMLPPVIGTSVDPTAAAPAFKAAHTLHLPNLKSNTAYQATVFAQTKNGTQLSQQVQFNTARERIRVTVESIDITQGGALIGDPSPLWTLGAQWGVGSPDSPSGYNQAGTCFPANGYPNGICQYGSYGDGTFQPHDTFGKPLSWVFAQENFDSMPTTFQLGASADVSTGWDLVDGYFGLVGSALEGLFGGTHCNMPPWRVPQGVENASATFNVCAWDDAHSFQSTVTYKVELFYDNLSYPALQRNQPSDPWANR